MHLRGGFPKTHSLLIHAINCNLFETILFCLYVDYNRVLSTSYVYNISLSPYCHRHTIKNKLKNNKMPDYLQYGGIKCTVANTNHKIAYLSI